MAFDVEAEGGELVLRNSFGDYAIVPRKDVDKVKKMMKDGCDNCIDNYVMNLPTAKNYAEGGTKVSDETREMYDMVNGDGAYESDLSAGKINERDASSNRFSRQLWKQLNEKLKATSNKPKEEVDEYVETFTDEQGNTAQRVKEDKLPPMEKPIVGYNEDGNLLSDEDIAKLMDDSNIQKTDTQIRQEFEDKKASGNLVNKEKFENRASEIRKRAEDEGVGSAEDLKRIMQDYDAELESKGEENPFKGQEVVPFKDEVGVDVYGSDYYENLANREDKSSTAVSDYKPKTTTPSAPKRDATTDDKGFKTYVAEEGNGFKIPKGNEYRIYDDGRVEKKIQDKFIQLNNQDAVDKVLKAYGMTPRKVVLKENAQEKAVKNGGGKSNSSVAKVGSQGTRGDVLEFVERKKHNGKQYLIGKVNGVVYEYGEDGKLYKGNGSAGGTNYYTSSSGKKYNTEINDPKEKKRIHDLLREAEGTKKNNPITQKDIDKVVEISDPNSLLNTLTK